MTSDTTQPPAPATTPADLNRDIAELLGWQWRMSNSLWDLPEFVKGNRVPRNGGPGCRFLCPPEGPEELEATGRNADMISCDDLHPLADEDAVICGDAYRYVPDYCTDPAATLSLLEHLQTYRGVSREKSMKDVGAVNFTIYRDTVQIVEWSIWRGENGWNEGETLTEAIALSCRDALVALAKREVTP